MDKKGTEGKMLAVTEGRDDDSKGSSSYAMLPSDRKAVAETRSSASKSEIQIAEAKESFAKSWLLPEGLLLWWDSKGIFQKSKRDEVIKHMEKHRKFYESVVTFSVMVEKGDKGSYESLLDLYDELSEMEVKARRDAKSKAMCRMLKEFLDEKYKLDHNLKRVECVVLKQKIDNVEKSCERYRTAVSDIGQDMRELREENRDERVAQSSGKVPSRKRDVQIYGGGHAEKNGRTLFRITGVPKKPAKDRKPESKR